MSQEVLKAMINDVIDGVVEKDTQVTAKMRINQ